MSFRVRPPASRADSAELYVIAKGFRGSGVALDESDDALPVATAFERQDSSMLSAMSAADCLILRAPHAEAAAEGDVVSVIRLR